jgi:hypothetical protein
LSVRWYVRNRRMLRKVARPCSMPATIDAKVAHEHVPLGHLLGSPRERQRDRRQQRLRYESDGDADREHEPVRGRIAEE